MATVRDVLHVLETVAPTRFTYEGDKVGLQVGDASAKVTRAVVSLDRSLGAVSHAKSVGAELLLSHHPLIFAPIQTVDTSRHDTRTVLTLAEAKIAFIAAHTNWDCAQGGINDALTDRLGLTEVQPFGRATDVPQMKLVVFVPVEAANAVIDAMAEAGAGQIGAYRRCAFLSPGTGTYRKGDGPIHEIEEVRVESVVPPHRAAAVVRAVKKVHPYEEVAYDLLPLAPLKEMPAGRVGTLTSPMSLGEFVALVDQRLETVSLAWGDPERRIKRVAVVGGSADSEWMNAQRAGADVLVTGEVKQHIAVEASESGMPILSSGHYATEQPGVVVLRDRMAEALTEIEWTLFTPEPGIAGRPFTRNGLRGSHGSGSPDGT